jgi:predicted site-specific integrase-resolvase
MTDHAVGRAPGGHITVPTELAALAAGVSVATIRKWASRGKLTRYGSSGRAEYDLDEIRELMARVSPQRQARPPE